MRKHICLVLLVVMSAFVTSSARPAPVAARTEGAGERLPATQTDAVANIPPAAPGLAVPADPVLSGAIGASRQAGAPAGLTTAAPTAAGPALCRLGVGVVRRNINDYALNAPAALQGLRAGWYETWNTNPSPAQPNGMEMVQTINLHQWKWDAVKSQPVLYSFYLPYEVPYRYALGVSIPDLVAAVTGTPGSIWLVGNEIERRDWRTSSGGSTGQNEILPELYAQAYHDLYQVIKAADPTARVANGSVIAPSPLRLQYLSRVWDEYQRRYGTVMPVDVWNIHLYMGPEVRDGWGIDIPAGIDNVTTGMWVYTGDPNQGDLQVLVNKDFSQVPPLVTAFRTWMRDHGQQNKPLLITEFGVNMPDWIWPGQFTPERVYYDYMKPGLDYLQTAADPNLGYPADENRLVQGVNWYSLDGDAGAWTTSDPNYPGQLVFHQFFNGNLMGSGLETKTKIWVPFLANDAGNPPASSGQLPGYRPQALGLSILGTYWTNYVAAIAGTANLRALEVTGFVPYNPGGGPVTAQVTFVFSNSGNINLTQPFVVSIYDGTNNQLLYSTTVNGLAGCGRTAAVNFAWPNLGPGYHPLVAKVDPQGQIVETTKSDNQVSGGVLVGTKWTFLPFLGH